MTIRAVAADEQLTVYYGPGTWRLHGPDGRPVLEVRAGVIYYHPLFGRWRDLPPGDHISADGLEAVQVHWDGGWAVGITLAPGGPWRRLVRWEDSRMLITADDVARALADLTGCPLLAEEPEPPAIVRVSPVGGQAVTAPAAASRPVSAPPSLPEEAASPRPSPATPVTPAPVAPVVIAPEMPPASSSAAATATVITPPVAPPVYTVDSAADIRLPLRLGGGALLTRDRQDRLQLTIPVQSGRASAAITFLGLLTVAFFAGVIWLLRGGSTGINPLLGLVIAGVALTMVGLLGVVLLARLNQQFERRIVFDRAERLITFAPPEAFDGRQRASLASVHGVQLRGAATRRRGHLAYQRTVTLMLENGDVPIFQEIREAPLPPDPAVMPSLAALRRQADEQAGPSLARAAARVLAWYLKVPLADE
ncbi:MAG: hypothetical protein HPY64_10485 [Anaerolineae bacterium]|nr:hypothetical protein [Anaerolineae bacterium]